MTLLAKQYFTSVRYLNEFAATCFDIAIETTKTLELTTQIMIDGRRPRVFKPITEPFTIDFHDAGCVTKVFTNYRSAGHFLAILRYGPIAEEDLLALLKLMCLLDGIRCNEPLNVIKQQASLLLEDDGVELDVFVDNEFRQTGFTKFYGLKSVRR